MTRRLFDPAELNGAGDVRDIAGELDAYARETASEAPAAFTDRVMSAIDARAGAPTASAVGGGLFASFASLWSAAKAAPIAAVLVVAVGVGGVLAMGQVTGIFEILPTPSPSLPGPTAVPSASPSAGVSPSGSATPTPSASGSPTGSPSPSPSPSDVASATPSPGFSPGSPTPTPSP